MCRFNLIYSCRRILILACSVPVIIHGGPSAPEIRRNPKHKKNTEIGEKKTVYSANILVEQEDAVSFDDNEEACILPDYILAYI